MSSYFDTGIHTAISCDTLFKTEQLVRKKGISTELKSKIRRAFSNLVKAVKEEREELKLKDEPFFFPEELKDRAESLRKLAEYEEFSIEKAYGKTMSRFLAARRKKPFVEYIKR